MNIGEAGRLTGLPAKTIRYYEDIGLIRSPRRENGYRHYGEGELHRLAFLQRARSLGFSIDECRKLLSLYDDEERASADVKQLAADHIVAIEHKIAELESLRDTLATLVEACYGDQRPDCPILKDIAGVAG